LSILFLKKFFAAKFQNFSKKKGEKALDIPCYFCYSGIKENMRILRLLKKEK